MLNATVEQFLLVEIKKKGDKSMRKHILIISDYICGIFQSVKK